MLSTGARVPRPYKMSTSTYHTRTKVSITPDAQGNFSFVLIGRPQQTLWIGGNTPGAVTSGMSAYSPNTNMYYAATTAGLGALVSEWRSVANGAHIHNLQPAATAIGQIFVARTSLNRKIPGPNLLGTIAPGQPGDMLPFLCGMSADANGHVPISIENLAGCREYTIDEICGNEIIISNVPVSESAYDFNAAGALTTLFNSTTRLADTFVSNTSNTVVSGATDTADTTECAGWSCTLVRGTGFPINDPATPVLMLHIGMHIEGIATIATTASGGSQFVPDAIPPASGGKTIDTLLQYASTIDSSTLVNTAVHAAQAYDAYMGLRGAGRVGRHLLTNG
jgi:hypothetical protein